MLIVQFTNISFLFLFSERDNDGNCTLMKLIVRKKGVKWKYSSFLPISSAKLNILQCCHALKAKSGCTCNEWWNDDDLIWAMETFRRNIRLHPHSTSLSAGLKHQYQIRIRCLRDDGGQNTENIKSPSSCPSI